ncbi:MAG: universal stress protein [Chloroflexi bacterium]|nr:universal stress protein [Chloroflexota bacterium]
MTNTYANLDRILLPLDGSTAAASIVPYIERLAGMLGARINLLGVIPEPPSDMPSDVTGSAHPGVVMQYLEVIKRQLEEHDIRAEVEVQEGQATAEILACAKARHCGLIALSTRGRSATGPNLLGITTDRVIRSSPAPVLVIPPDEDGGARAPAGGLKTVIVGLDGSETAATSLAPARQIARALNVEIVVVRATPPVDSLGGAATYFDSVSHHAEQYVKRVAERLTAEGFSARTVVGSLSAQEQLLRVADDSEEPLIILSTRGWSNRADWQLGSVTDRVVRTARHPALIIPPAGRSEVG